MYETIMSTPIFKGLSHNDISILLERIPFSVTTVSAGGEVVNFDNPIDTIKFILSGEATALHRIGEMVLSETFDCERVVSADRLFGYHRNSDVEVTADTNLAVLSCGKQEFIKMLHTNSILMINYLNYLSIRAQRPADCLTASREPSLRCHISFWLKMLCDRSSKRFSLLASPEMLSRQTNLSPEAVVDSLYAMEISGKITISDRTIKISDRDYFDFL